MSTAVKTDDASFTLPTDGTPEAAFLNRVHHEMRTPLFAILTAAEILRQSSNGGAKWVVDILDQNASHLKVLIDDLLLFADLARENPDLQPAALGIDHLATEHVNRRREDIDKKGIQVELWMDEDLPKIWADERLVRACLSHLVDNAIKFNKEGGRIEVSASMVRGQVEVRIANTGDPIPKEEQDRVFQGFTQIEQVLTRTAGGMGIGLAIVRKAIEAQQGAVSLARLPEGLNLFSIRLPVQP